MALLITIFTAIGVSMDTFSLSLSYGMFKIEKKTIIKISTIVGLFHFVMPILGNIVGEYILKILPINENKLMGIIFIVLILEVLISMIKKEEAKPLKNNLEILLFAFAVSIDSFTTGIGLDAINLPNVIISLIFMIISFAFTYVGLSFGKVLNEKIGEKSKIVGIIILSVLSLKYLLL